MFGVKDPIPCGLHTCVVYKFLCAGCTACTVGETSRRLSTCAREHLVSDRTSHIFICQHHSPQCRTLCSEECFNILDHASTTFQRKIKEAIHIQWEKPTLNHQLYHVNSKLSSQRHILFCYYHLFCYCCLFCQSVVYFLKFFLVFCCPFTFLTLTGPCEQGNWDTWMVLDPWNQV